MVRAKPGIRKGGQIPLLGGEFRWSGRMGLECRKGAGGEQMRPWREEGGAGGSSQGTSWWRGSALQGVVSGVAAREGERWARGSRRDGGESQVRRKHF